MKHTDDITNSAHIRAFTKTELALMYNPNSSPRAAVQTLKRWIQYNKELSYELRKIGYNPKRHTLYSTEVELLYKYIGTP